MDSGLTQSQKILYTLEHVAVGSNRQSNSSCAGRNGLVAYSASKLVAIYDPTCAQLLGTLPGHSDTVTSVRWLPNIEECNLEFWNTPEFELVSSSVDKTLIVWKTSLETLGRRPLRFEKTAVLKGHESSVSCFAVHANPITNTFIIASGSIDGTVILWNRKGGSANSWVAHQVLKFETKMVESMAIASIPGSHLPLLACGSVDNMVHLFACDEDSLKFTKLTSLTGYESWIRSLDFASFTVPSPKDVPSSSANTTKKEFLLLASASQDRRVRLWKLETQTSVPCDEASDALQKLDPAALLAKLEADEEGQLEIEQHSIVVNLKHGLQLSVKLESVILGHDEWVMSVRWMPPFKNQDGIKVQLPRLLTSSMDKTMVVWTPDKQTGLWIEATRVGEFGGNQLGFFGSAYLSHPQEAILALGYNGAFHLWSRSSTDSEDGERWYPQETISGHFQDVKDIAWEPSGAYFVTVSKDQTARLWARWANKEQAINSKLPGLIHEYNLVASPSRYNWQEIGRPQVHGHDISGVTFQRGVAHRLITCAEEKVVRVFDGPVSFLQTLTNVCGHVAPSEQDILARAVGANIPALGLSNKPVYSKASNSASDRNAAEQLYAHIHPKRGYADFDVDTSIEGHPPLVLRHPPFEEQLLQRTVWPEIAKLYGHGNELITVCSSRTGDIITSACSCKAQTQEQAGIRVWDTTIWKEVCELKGPTLTVTHMEFSHSDRFMTAVSRDRGIYLFQRLPGKKSMELVASSPKAHLRIVWSCSWSWDDKFLATGSRDKTVKLWKINESNANEAANTPSPAILQEYYTIKCKDAVTSICFIPTMNSADYFLVVGMENGSLEVWTVTSADSYQSPPTLSIEFHPQDAHADSVERMDIYLRSPEEYDLITCSADHSIRLFKVFIPSNSNKS